MKTIKTTLPIIGFWDTRQGGRSENQDSCGFLDTPHGLIAIVCDGMGGGPAGKQASILAVKAVAEYICQAPDKESLEHVMSQAVEHAHQSIISEGKKHLEMDGMGSTIAAVLFNDKAAIVAHVGDSRVYQFRRGEKVFRTQDHSWVADRVREGNLTEEEAKLTGQTNLITRALGGKGIHSADIISLAYEKGDRFLLCTDGVWGMLTEKDLTRRAAQTPSLAGAVDSIALRADEIGRNNGNSHDNLTLALFETKQDSVKKVKMNRKALYIIKALIVLCIVSLVANCAFIVNSLKPNVEKEQLKRSEQLLKEQEVEMIKLKNRIDSLRNELVNSKDAILNARMEVEAEKNKAAEKAEEEARKKTEEAQKAAEKAKEEAARVQKVANDIAAVVDYLRQASTKKKGAERKPFIKKAYDILDNLSKKDVVHRKTYDDIRQKLGNPIATSNSDKAKGHFDLLIKELEKIKK